MQWKQLDILSSCAEHLGATVESFSFCRTTPGACNMHLASVALSRVGNPAKFRRGRHDVCDQTRQVERDPSFSFASFALGPRRPHLVIASSRMSRLGTQT